MRTTLTPLLAVLFLVLFLASPGAALPEVLYFPFEEGSGTTTENHAAPGVGSSNPSFNGSVTWVSGQVGTHAVDTTNGYIDTGWNTEFTGSFTIEFWFNFQGSGLAWYPCGDSSHSNFRMFTSGGAGDGMRVAGGGFTSLTVGSGLHTGWHHFAFVYDASAQTTTAYVNGTNEGGHTGQVPVSGASSGTFQVASHNQGSRTFPGYLDEFRFWDHARTEQEINDYMNVTLQGDDLTVSLEGPNTTQLVDAHSTGPTGDGYVLAEVTLTTRDEDWTVSEIEFSADGTGNDADAFDELALYEDTTGSESFDGSGQDQLATASPGVAFNANNGTYTATLDTPSVPASTTRRFFLVGRFDGSASAGETFTAGVSSVNATSPGPGSVVGVPTGYSAGLEIRPETVTVTRHGPSGAQIVPFDAQDVMLLDISVETNTAFTIDMLELRSFGSGNDAEHYQEVALYEDDGSGSFDPGTDTLVTSTNGFPTAGGTWEASLSDPSFAPGVIRRFFVVGSFNGTAANGLTFGVSLQGLDISSPSAYDEVGVPSSGPTSVIIETPLEVSDFSPLETSNFNEAPIEISGTGLTLPVTVTIGGEEAGGTAELNPSQTRIIGLTTPSRSGANLEIVIEFEGEEPIVFEETFTYSRLTSGNGGCAAILGEHTLAPWALTIVALFVLLLWRRHGTSAASPEVA